MSYHVVNLLHLSELLHWTPNLPTWVCKRTIWRLLFVELVGESTKKVSITRDKISPPTRCPGTCDSLVAKHLPSEIAEHTLTLFGKSLTDWTQESPKRIFFFEKIYKTSIILWRIPRVAMFAFNLVRLLSTGMRSILVVYKKEFRFSHIQKNMRTTGRWVSLATETQTK